MGVRVTVCVTVGARVRVGAGVKVEGPGAVDVTEAGTGVV
jgi:hypothetical protein